jgi:hypothetical protein
MSAAYVVVTADSREELESQVNALLPETLVEEDGTSFVRYHQPLLLEPDVDDEAPRPRKCL